MRAQTQKPRPCDDTPAAPMTREEMMHSILRKLAAVMNLWRECPARVCKRARRCASPAIPCTRLPPRREFTPEDDVRLRADLHRRVKRRMAEIERERAAAADDGRRRPGARKNAQGIAPRAAASPARTLPFARPEATPAARRADPIVHAPHLKGGCD